MNTSNQLHDYGAKQYALNNFLNSDDIVNISDEEYMLLDNMNGCLKAYLKILRRKLAEEDEARNIILKLGDTRCQRRN